MTPTRRLLFLAAALCAQLGFASFAVPSARAADALAPVLLVAAPTRTGPYERAVLLALPSGNGTNFGFILNLPTQTSVAALFPDSPAAKQVSSPVFIGGPQLRESVFALVRSAYAPGDGSREVLPGLFMAFESDDVARVVERFPGRARFYAGLVAWDEGELQSEIESGAWHVLEPDVELVIQGSVDTLWKRLMEHASRATVEMPGETHRKRASATVTLLDQSRIFRSPTF